MAKLPAPPPEARLREMAPALVTMARGTLLWRVYFRDGEHEATWRSFRSFGPTSARFDHHRPPPRDQSRAVYYAAHEVETCIAEVFQRRRKVDRLLKGPWLAGLELDRDLRLLDLTGPWPTRAGASMAIHTGRRDLARAWSRAIYEAFPEVQGLLCCSSMDANRRTAVLYERAARAMPARPVLHRALSDPDLLPLLTQAALRFGYELA